MSPSDNGCAHFRAKYYPTPENRTQIATIAPAGGIYFITVGSYDKIKSKQHCV